MTKGVRQERTLAPGAIGTRVPSLAFVTLFQGDLAEERATGGKPSFDQIGPKEYRQKAFSLMNG